MASTSKLIKQRIESMGTGSVFIPSDFLDLGSQQAVKLVLSRLEKAGKIKRVVRGVYAVPAYSDYLKKELTIAPSDVVAAIARNNGWIVVPAGDNALNSLGLSTQVPARFEYVSSGPYKKYDYNGIEIELKHRANRDLINKRYKSALVIQALKKLGQKNVDKRTIDTLARALSPQEIEGFYEDAKTSLSWIYEVAKSLKARSSS